jgi:RNA polymerase sigma-70 factor (ECF subfamily)
LPPGDEGGSQDEAPVSADASPLDELARAEQIEALRKAVLTLPVAYREAVVLCDLQEMSYAEAAVALECAVGTVRSRLHRGRALLASKMAGHAPGAAPARIERAGGDSEQSGPAAKAVSRCIA